MWQSQGAFHTAPSYWPHLCAQPVYLLCVTGLRLFAKARPPSSPHGTLLAPTSPPSTPSCPLGAPLLRPWCLAGVYNPAAPPSASASPPAPVPGWTRASDLTPAQDFAWGVGALAVVGAINFLRVKVVGQILAAAATYSVCHGDAPIPSTCAQGLIQKLKFSSKE